MSASSRTLEPLAFTGGCGGPEAAGAGSAGPGAAAFPAEAAGPASEEAAAAAKVTLCWRFREPAAAVRAPAEHPAQRSDGRACHNELVMPETTGKRVPSCHHSCA